MTKTSRNSTAATEESFHKHYAAIWGEERWQSSLYPALAESTRQAALVNRYAPMSEFQANIQELADSDSLEQIAFLKRNAESDSSVLCFTLKPESRDSDGKCTTKAQHNPLPQPRPSANGLLTHWNLDAASALAASLLNAQPGERLLDLCAAPGGKSIALAQKIWPHIHADQTTKSSPSRSSSLGHFRSNESDHARFKRLTQNLKAYLPAELFESKQVTSLCVDATDPLASRKLSSGSGGYDNVLVDAPCSSERHIVHAQLAAKSGGRVAPEMANWRPGSSKRLAKTQVDLVMTALRSVKVGGNVLYATCSIEMNENDGVVEKVLAAVQKEVKKGCKWTIKVGFDDEQLETELEKQWAERTRCGWIVLPDHPTGGRWGPLYFVMLTKVDVELD